MSGPGFASSSGCLVPLGTRGVPGMRLMDDMQLEQSRGLSLPRCPGSPLVLPWAGGHEVGVGEALEVSGDPATPTEPAPGSDAGSRLVCLLPSPKTGAPWLQGSSTPRLSHVS